MRLLYRIHRALIELFRRSKWERETDEELRAFVEMSAADRLERGVPGPEALRSAKLSAGGIEQTRERLRDERVGSGLESLWRDVRYGARLIRRQPGFSAIVIATLALGIGANTAIFSVVESVLLAPLPFAESDGLVRLLVARGHGDAYALASAPPPAYFHAIRERSTLLERVAAQRYQNLTLSGEGEPERIVGIGVSDGWLETLGIRPVIGRGFDAAEQAAGSSSSVVLLSHAFWQRRFGGDRSINGRVLRLNQRDYTVIGVLPPSFRYPYQADLWLPMTFPPAATSPGDLNVPARLRPGATVAQLRSELDGIGQQLARELPGFDNTFIVVRPFADEFRRDPGRSISALLAAVGFVLLLACVNVANLMLARSGARASEIAVRSALGASRGRQVRQLLAESLLLAGAGGLLGTVLAFFATRWLGVLIPSRLGEVVSSVRMDGPVLVACVLLCLLTGIFFGLPPALRMTQHGAGAALRQRGASRSAAGNRLLESLVVAEVALATLLLTGAGLMGRNFSALLATDVGYATDGLVRIKLGLSDPVYADPARRSLTMRRVLDRVEAVPGVLAAGFTTLQPVPRTTANTGTSFVTDVFDEDLDLPPVANLRMVSPGYFEAMGMTVVAGRAFTDADAATGAPVLIVNQSAARRFWSGRDAVGHRVKPGNVADTTVAWHDVVGVVSDIAEPYDEIRETIYLPYAQATASQAAGTWTTTSVSLLARVRTVDGGIDAIGRAIHDVDPAMPVFDVMSMRGALAEPLSGMRLGAVAIAGFGAFGLLMAVLGTYGVLAFAVHRRTAEFGMRVALGASPSSILAMVIRRGLLLVLGGLGIGTAIVLALGRPLRAVISEVGPRDPVALGLSAAVMLVTGAIACYLPARRATRVDPVTALRCD